MCLYITEPMTIEQGKQMRGRLNYYDKVLGEIEGGDIPNGIIDDFTEKNFELVIKEL